MTFDKLNELNAMKDVIQQMTDDIDNLDEFGNYHTIQIIGRIDGERLGDAEVLLTIDGDYYPGLIEIIRKYIVDKRKEVIKDFEEA